MESSSGLLTADRSLIVRSWDAWIAEATGLTADAACGTSLLEIYPEIEARGLDRLLRKTISDGTVAVLAPAFHGHLLPCPPLRPSPYFERMQQRVTLTPLRAGESIEGIVIRIEDVTERREEERRFADRLSSGDEVARLEAVREVAEGSQRADVLSTAFGDRSWRVRSTAAKAAAQDESDTAADLLIELLRENHRDLAVLNAAISAVARSRAGVLPRLLPLLRDPDEDLRNYVTLVLGLLGDPDAVPPLLELLRDESVNVRFHAMEALGRLADHRAVEALLPIAESGDFFLSAPACEALAEIGDEGVAPRLLPLLSNELLAPVVLDATARLGGVESIGAVVRLLESGLASVEEIAAAIATIHGRLESRGGGAAVEAFVRTHLSDADVRAIVAAYPSASAAGRQAIVKVAAWVDHPAIDELLISALEEADTQLPAVEGLISRGSRAAAPLSASLDRLEPAACAAAVVALGRIGNTTVVPALARMLNTRPGLAVTTAAALGAIGSRESLRPLLELLDSPDPAVRQAAVGALNSIGHPELPARVSGLISSPSPHLRESAARIVCYFGYPGAFDAVLSLTRDPVESVRRTAIEHLVSFDDPAVGARLREVLLEDVPAVRAAAARAVGLVAIPESPDLALLALGDEDLWVRYHAARSTSPVSGQQVLARLRDLAANDEVVPVRIAAIASLAAHADEPSVPLLVELATNSREPELEREALIGLAHIPSAAAEAHLLEVLRHGADDARLAILESRAPLRSPALRKAAVDVVTTSSSFRVVDAALDALLHSGATAEDIALLADSASRSAGREVGRRRAIVAGIAAVGARYLDQIGMLLRHPEARVRFIGMEILSRTSHSDLASIVAPALADSAPEVKRLAALLLERLDLRQTVFATAGSSLKTRDAAVGS